MKNEELKMKNEERKWKHGNEEIPSYNSQFSILNS
jgi:hypothetical protein